MALTKPVAAAAVPRRATSIGSVPTSSTWGPKIQNPIKNRIAIPAGSQPSATSSIQITGARRPPKKRSVAQPEKIAPTIPPQGSTAYLNAAEITLAACVSVNCVTPQSVNPYRHASSKQSAIPMNHSAGLDSVRTILFRNEFGVMPLQESSGSLVVV